MLKTVIFLFKKIKITENTMQKLKIISKYRDDFELKNSSLYFY